MNEIIELASALLAVADQLDADCCWFHDGRFHFPLADGWSFALSLDSAGRFRCEACHGVEPRDMLLCLFDDHERLAALVTELSSQVV